MKRLFVFLMTLSVALTVRAADPETLIVAFQPQENPERLQLHAEGMTKFLSAELGMPVKIYLPTDYAAVVEALRAGHAHVAYFSAWPYMLAHELAGAEIVLAEVRGTNTFYYSQWYARKDGPINSLADAKGKRAAFTAPSSTSGYLFPLAKLIEDGLLEPKGNPATFFHNVLFAGGYEQALKALVHGQVDVAAASDYAFTQYLTPEEQAQVKVIARQGPVPTHCIAVKNTLSGPLRQKIGYAFLKLNAAAHRDLLKSVYGAQQLTTVNHHGHTAGLKRALELTGLDYPLKQK